MSHCTIRVSIGELFDKYTILEIKQERITDVTKLEYLSREISMLDLIISKYPVSYNLIKTLKTTNAKLWDIEDKIRIKEREKCFDAEFIELARSVYITNDERCRIKNNISALFNDDIMDVKSYVDFAPAPAPIVVFLLPVVKSSPELLPTKVFAAPVVVVEPAL